MQYNMYSPPLGDRSEGLIGILIHFNAFLIKIYAFLIKIYAFYTWKWVIKWIKFEN